MRPSWSHKLKVIHLKRQLGVKQLARSCAHEPIAHSAVDNLPTPVVVGQPAANCLEEAVRSFPVMWSRCRSSRADITFRRPLPVYRVVRYSSVHCFQTPITVAVWCSAEHELLLCDRKVILLEGQ
ncbi:uncharacterized protein TNCV_3085511 [Trichonephila clavipes]|nr:uncharacterized protein TNCV_3085511 [Trichonephila clavipes]